MNTTIFDENMVCKNKVHESKTHEAVTDIAITHETIDDLFEYLEPRSIDRTILAILPIYFDGADGSIVVFYNGSRMTVKKSTRRVLKIFASNFGIDLTLLRKKLGFAKRWSQPLPITDEHLFLPVPMREYVIGRDSTLGYINVIALKQSRPFPTFYSILQGSSDRKCTYITLPHTKIVVYQPLGKVYGKMEEALALFHEEPEQNPCAVPFNCISFQNYYTH